MLYALRHALQGLREREPGRAPLLRAMRRRAQRRVPVVRRRERAGDGSAASAAARSRPERPRRRRRPSGGWSRCSSPIWSGSRRSPSRATRRRCASSLTRYFDTCRRLVERYGGTVEKFIGDAVMAVWGTPTAQEDDAERAVRVALDLVDAVHALGE